MGRDRRGSGPDHRLFPAPDVRNTIVCELFALSAEKPVNIRYDLKRFAAEGGERHRNRDGWGIALVEGADAHLFREAAPASDSALDRFLSDNVPPHATMIAHVRRASSGTRSLENTHPFRRVQAGRVHHFAHNGTLIGLEVFPEAESLTREAVGQTDSEIAFLILLGRLARDAPDQQDTAGRFEVFVTFCADMRELGPANFLWLDGDVVHVHPDRRHFETRNGLTDAQPPGLHMLRPDAGHSYGRHALVGAEIDALPENAVIFASLPLSDHRWEPLARGTVLSISAGRINYRSPMRSD